MSAALHHCSHSRITTASSGKSRVHKNIQGVGAYSKIITKHCCEMFDLFPIQVLHEELEIPGSSIKLSYLSSRAPGYKSLLKITMTQSLVPLNLIKVHLMVAVEGHLFQKSFQASPNLAYTFIWDKTDAYGQKVYGLSDAVGKLSLHKLQNISTLVIYSKKSGKVSYGEANTD